MQIISAPVIMGINTSNLTSSEYYNNVEFIVYINNNTYYALQVLGFIYTLVCVFWLVYVIFKLTALVRNRRSLINLSYLNTEHDYKIRIFMHRETILRNSIFLVFLCFELCFCLVINLWGTIFHLLDYQDPLVPIGHNCTLQTWSYLAGLYDKRFGIIVLRFLYILMSLSFSMMIWLFGVSLFHLSFAARNELRVKAVIRYFLLGLVIYLVLMFFVLIPYTSIFGIMAQSVMDEISILIAFYIAKRRFFPAMNSRVIDAFHFNNVRVYLEQKRLLYRYKVLICFLICTFEIYVLKNLFLHNFGLLLESIIYDPCWFHVTYHLPTLMLSQFTNHILDLIYSYSILFSHLADLVVYTNFIIVNLAIYIYNFRKILLKRIFCKKKRECYRYQPIYEPLLSAN